jgi:RNA polymerase sigma factor (sigma-70 family)
MDGEGSSGTVPVMNRDFTTTHWSVVLAAGQEESPLAAAALEKLCRIYWYPLYVYVRRRGHSPEDAQDLTQQFFALFLQKEYFRLADPRRGRFRTFLLHALQHFLVNEWKRAQRAKRGGGSLCLSLDADEAERRYVLEPVTTLTPERAYEKRWARTLLEQVLAVLQQEYTQSGQGRVFEELAEMLWGRDTSVSYVQIGERLGLTEGAVGAAMHRLRQRYRERLRAEVTHTVAEPGEVDEELHYLLRVVSQEQVES